MSKEFSLISIALRKMEKEWEMAAKDLLRHFRLVSMAAGCTLQEMIVATAFRTKVEHAAVMLDCDALTPHAAYYTGEDFPVKIGDQTTIEVVLNKQHVNFSVDGQLYLMTPTQANKIAAALIYASNHAEFHSV